MRGEVSDEQLWSWIDRGAADLEDWLAANPGERERVLRLQGLVGQVRNAVQAGASGLPQRIGPFRVLGWLGAGGAGVVYSAVEEATGRAVALKVLRDGPPAGRPNERGLEREIESLERLNHPGIAAIDRAGRTEDGAPWIAMERVDGRPLQHVLREPALARDARLRLILQILDAVAHAHSSGVVHRDLKPSNVMVTNGGMVKVLDFGLAKLLGAPASASTLAATGAVVGTLQYMSPEQARGARGAVGPAADVWSLGVMLFEALTGELPIAVRDASVGAALEAVQRGAARPLRRIDPSIDPELSAIVETALAPDPARRYPDAAAFAADLRRYLAREAVLARPLGFGERLRWVLRRHALRLAAAASLLALAATAWALRPAIADLASLAFLRGDGSLERSPWSEVTWPEDRALIRLDAGERAWLLAVDGEPVELLIGVAKRGAQGLWRKRFEEDFTTLFREVTGRDLGSPVDLLVRPAEPGAPPILVPGVPVTREKRAALWRANQPRAPFDSCRFEGDALIARCGGEWVRVRAIDGHSIAELLQVAAECARPEHARPGFGAILMQALEQLDGVPGKRVRVELEPCSGGEVESREVELDGAAGEALRLEAEARVRGR